MSDELIQLIGLVFLFFGFLLIEFVYFKIADRFSIIDKPNERSSHRTITIRGGGIIFPIAWLSYSLWNGLVFPWFTSGLLLISAISFLDDVKPQTVKVRFSIHMVSLILLFLEIQNWMPEFNLIWLIPGFIIITGIINAVNFMDGINGITGLYGLAFFIPFIPFWNPNSTVADLDLTNPISYVLAALLVFGIFNFRRKAKCFAGDVGSVSLAYLMVFFLIQKMSGFPGQEKLETLDWKYILFFAVYGVDSIMTILHRIKLKENIFKAHRKHLYQYLSNEMKWPHMVVALIYALVQLAINYWVSFYTISLLEGIILLGSLALLYVFIKWRILMSLSHIVDIKN